MADSTPTVSFLSDLGTQDESVGVCKGVIHTIAPGVEIIDIAHDLPAFDVRAAALALVRAIQYLPAGVVLGVVDPAAGAARRAIAVEVEDHILVGPDNGLLAPAAALVGGARRVVDLDVDRFALDAPGATFAARDVFAPAAGHLARGVDLVELGTLADPDSLTPGVVPVSDLGADRVTGSVWWIDRFGNAELNVDPAELTALGATVGGTLEVHLGGQVRMARWVRAFADAKASELVLVVDGAGLLVLALDRASAAAEYDLREGTGVTLLPPPRRGVRIPVRSDSESR